MSSRQKARIIVLPILLALLFISLKYTMQPVDLYTVMPDLEINQIDVLVVQNNEEAVQNDRSLTLKAGTPEFDEVLSRLEALRFTRSAWNPVVKALPFLANLDQGESRQAEDGEIAHLFITLTQADPGRTEELDFWVDQWSYRDFERGVSLKLAMRGGKEIGQTLGQDLWQMAQDINFIL